MQAPRAPPHRRRWRRHSPGLVPTRRVKVRVKWLCSEKPQSRAICARDSVDHSNRSWARFEAALHQPAMRREAAGLLEGRSVVANPSESRRIMLAWSFDVHDPKPTLPDWRWISLNKSISPMSKRLAQSSLDLNAHVVRSVLLGKWKPPFDNPASFELYPL